MKNNAKLLVFIPIFLLILSAASFAEEEQRLFDDAGYFSAEDAESLNSLLLETEKSCGFYVSVLVADDIGDNKENYAAKNYADAYYRDNFGIDTDGMIYLINLDTGFDCIATSGHAIRIFTDENIEGIFDYVWDDMLNERFYNAMEKYCEAVEIYASSGVSEGQYNYDENTHEKDYYKDYISGGPISAGSFNLENALVFMAGGGAVGVVVAVVVILVVLSRYKVKPAKGAAEYLNRSSVRYHQSTDTFLRQYITARKIETSDGGSHGGGGRSTTRRSSGGGTFGGGGRQR